MNMTSAQVHGAAPKVFDKQQIEARADGPRPFSQAGKSFTTTVRWQALRSSQLRARCPLAGSAQCVGRVSPAVY